MGIFLVRDWLGLARDAIDRAKSLTFRHCERSEAIYARLAVDARIASLRSQ